MKLWLALSLCLTMLSGIAGGCSRAEAAGTVNLMQNITANPANDGALSEADAKKISAFSVKLLQSSFSNDNLLISPLSVLCAVGMATNGARENTLEQLQNVVGMDADALNLCMRAWLRSQNQSEGLVAANSVWFHKDALKIRDEFLQATADHYNADAYSTPFDNNTLSAINQWVNEHTDGMIPTILDRLPENARMYLINALSFRRPWENPYITADVQDSIFTTQSGQERIVPMMFSQEFLYLQDDTAVGFMKPYAGNKYAFAALLPQQDIDLQVLLANLDGERLYSLLTSAQSERIHVGIPKFDMEYNTELSGTFKKMGVTDAFDADAADFSGISTADASLFISRILHKACIKVNETGTEAAAATAVEVMVKGLVVHSKSVILDRPFIYMIVDLDANIPIFIGTITDIPAS